MCAFNIVFIADVFCISRVRILVFTVLARIYSGCFTRISKIKRLMNKSITVTIFGNNYDYRMQQIPSIHLSAHLGVKLKSRIMKIHKQKN
jgi:hypothetical protein